MSEPATEAGRAEAVRLRDALESLADAATALENRAIRSGGEFHVWAEERMLTEARDESRRILDEVARADPAPQDAGEPPSHDETTHHLRVDGCVDNPTLDYIDYIQRVHDEGRAGATGEGEA